jgi:WD40 repeat protein
LFEHSVPHFSPDSRYLLTTSDDGEMRLYALQEGKLEPAKRAHPSGGKRPLAARFSSDGRFIAVGFADVSVVQVLDAQTLNDAARPSMTGVEDSLGNVAWSADGRYLLASGRWEASDKVAVRRWPVRDWSHYEDLPLTSNTVMDLVPLPGGSVLFASQDPAWGVISSEFRVQQRRDAHVADLRNQWLIFGLSLDARGLRFGYEIRGRDAHSFDVASRTLGNDAPELAAARTSVEGLDVRNWKKELDPSLNGQALKLQPYETSRSLAIAPDAQRFVLGTEWWLRLFDRSGKQLWAQPVPGVAWVVNWSTDGRYIVAGYGDGTIRWHRPSDGAEVLAFFPHADRKRWIVWTPEGFYAASDSEAEELMGYHLNRGKDREGEFISARQLREHFYQPGLISRRLDADGDALVAEAVKKLGDVQQLLTGAKALPPLVELISDAELSGEEEVTIKVRVEDRGGGVGGLIYYVDGAPQTGRQAGVFADGTESRTFAYPPGSRRIEVAALNRNGVEGTRQAVVATFTGPARDAALHIFAVGIEKYQSPRLELRHSTADAREVADEIAKRAKSLFRRGVSVPRVLTESQASLRGIEEAFAEMKKAIKPEDTLVIFLAGHGEAPIDKGYTFLPWDFEPGGEGLNETRLRKMLADSPTQTLLLLDTCDAGGATDMIAAAYDRLGVISKRAMIGASRRGQLAREGYKGHGVFSAALLNVMAGKSEDGEDNLGVHALKVYVDREVNKIIRAMGGGYQQKVSSFLGSADFPLVKR